MMTPWTRTDTDIHSLHLLDVEADRISYPANTPLSATSARTSTTPLQEPVNYNDRYGGNIDYHPVTTRVLDNEDTVPPVARPPSELIPSSTLRWWLPEVLAAVVSTAAVAVILILLKVCDGRAIQEINLPGSLTINVIVAAISTVTRITLMVPVGSALSQEAWLWFTDIAQLRRCRSRLIDLELSDAASRGAWGSLVFLISARRRWLAYLGALVTVASLTLGTLTQQLIGYDYYPVPMRDSSIGSASIPRAESLGAYYLNTTSPIRSLPFRLRAAIYNGIFGEQISPLAASCPNGNCTWPVTPSLAVCAQCDPTYIVSSSCDGDSCTYELGPNNMVTLMDASKRTSGVGFRVNVPIPKDNNDGTQSGKLYITQFDVIGATYQSSVKQLNNSEVRASQCAMWFCVNTYNVSTHAGAQTQRTVSTHSRIDGWEPSTGVIGKSDTIINYKFFEMNDYSVSNRGRDVFRDTFTKIFNGTATLGPSMNASSVESDGVDAIWKASDNLDPWIKNLATSMTNAIRFPDTIRLSNGATEYNRAYRGSTFELGIKVRWQWMWPPIILVGLSHIFLIFVMMYTAWSTTAPWKGSPLTFLFLDVDQRLKRRVGQPGLLRKSQGLQDEVGGARVYLTEEPGRGWVFKAR